MNDGERCTRYIDCTVTAPGFTATLRLECDLEPGHRGDHHDWEHCLYWAYELGAMMSP
jgi:hypothetical protein